jgi:hypothetical protein
MIQTLVQINLGRNSLNEWHQSRSLFKFILTLLFLKPETVPKWSNECFFIHQFAALIAWGMNGDNVKMGGL